MHGSPGYFEFIDTAVSGNLLHHSPAAVARLEVAQRIRARRIFSQLRFDQADVFENDLEVEPRQRSKTAECIRCRDGLGRFPRVLRPDHLHEGFSKAFFDPLLRRTQRQFFIVKLFRERRNEVRLPRNGLGFQISKHGFEDIGAGACAARQAIRPEIRRLPQLLAAIDARGQFRQLLDQRDPQKQRKGPQFRDRERRLGLRVLEALPDACVGDDVVRFGNQIACDRADAAVTVAGTCPSGVIGRSSLR